jgi:hypothetical protein
LLIKIIIYLILVQGLLGVSAVASIKQTEWYQSTEFLMFVSVLVGYNVNKALLGSCH